ncbi:pilus assembly protein TadG-related protein [Kocuria palustris]|uniref:pilus assembly protein TadG-related protein n=1 Tax=Kocuria palustris TaxID=71999 RepID=UPI0011A57998|nr:pilus assembly protein TadG-related protein [Kocuria palustris]
MSRPRADEDDGQISILVIGMMLILLLAMIVVMAVTSVHLAERKLQVHADHAALGAADTFTQLHGTEGTGTAPTAVLDDASVSGAAESYLLSVEAEHDLDGLAIGTGTGSTDGRTARVHLTAVARPPVVAWIVPAGIPVEATGEARAEFGR